MGKSDHIVYEWYRSRSIVPHGRKVLFLGQVCHNEFTKTLGSDATFLDLSLGNWEINTGPWPSEKFDAVVCTRCAYFASDAQAFIDRCRAMLNPGGVVFIDWGLGDHWRFEKFKVGWVSRGEHEYSSVGDHRSHLFSTFWSEELESHPHVANFKTWIERFGYSGPLASHIAREVPSIASSVDAAECMVDCLALWPESPQLYILTQFRV